MPEEIDEIEEKLKNMKPKELIDLTQKLSRSATLTDERRQEIRELSLLLIDEIKQNEGAANRLLREQGGQILKLINQLRQDNSLSDARRKELDTLAAEIAGYRMRDWLPEGLFRKILMLLFLMIGLIGVAKWSLWFWSLIIFAAAFSPRIVGTVFAFIGALSRDQRN